METRFKPKKVTDKMLRQAFKEEHSKRAYNAHISRNKRYGGGIINLIIANGLSTEIYS